jgi:hypothetical protein
LGVTVSAIKDEPESGRNPIREENIKKRRKREPVSRLMYLKPLVIRDSISPVFIPNGQTESLIDEPINKIWGGAIYLYRNGRGYHSLVFNDTLI